jgi:hypothetical protein
MNRKTVGVVATIGIVLAASVSTARAQTSSGSTAIDASLRGAVERNDVPGGAGHGPPARALSGRLRRGGRRDWTSSRPTRCFVSRP